MPYLRITPTMSPETMQKKQTNHQACRRTEGGHNDTVDLQHLRNMEVILESRHEVCILGAAARSFQWVTIIWHESLLHQEDEVGQYLSQFFWDWVFLPSDRVFFLSLLSGGGRWNDKKQSLFCQGQCKAKLLSFDLYQQQPSGQACGHLPARTRPQEFLAPKNATCFLPHTRGRGGGKTKRKEILLFRSFQVLDVMEEVIISLGELKTAVQIFMIMIRGL